MAGETPAHPGTEAPGAENPAGAPGIDRRELLKVAGLAGVGLAGAGLAGALGTFACVRERGSPKNALVEENARPGTTDWLLTQTRVDPASRYRCPWIEGYASATSVAAGETIRFFVSTEPASPFRLDLYRLGYYGGTGGRRVASLGPFSGRSQRVPDLGVDRRRDCAWEAATELAIPADWPSGVYLGKLTAERGGCQSYVVFIVRDERPCHVLFQCSDSTWAAYNRWPHDGSLYDDGKKEWYWGPNVQAGWDRPYGRYCQIVDAPLSQGSGEFLLWEFPLAYWLEKEGYDVSYVGNVDTHRRGETLARAKIFLSVGHDEYWSREMFDHVGAARDAGVDLAFLSGNTCYGLVDFHPNGAGAGERAIRRIGQFGPIEPKNALDFPEILTLPSHGPDESLLIGARSGYPVTGAADWICTAENHWLFADTGMKNGDRIPGLVGWEWHGTPAPIPGLDVVAAGRIRRGREAGRYTATVYPGPRGNFVFNAATIWWADGLSQPPGYVRPGLPHVRPKGPDPRVQKITANLLARSFARAR
jgi:hypothetical protein